MIQTLPITPLSAALGAMLVELRLLATHWPVELERRTFEGAQPQLHRDVTEAIQRLPRIRRRPSIVDPDAAVFHQAYMTVLVLAVMVKRFTRRARKRRIAVPSTEAMAAAGAAVLDALEPFVDWADIAVRRTMLDGDRNRARGQLARA